MDNTTSHNWIAMVSSSNVLIYWYGAAKSKYCGIKFDNGFILSSGLILADIICSKEMPIKQKQAIKLKLSNHKPIVFDKSKKRFRYLKSMKFNVISSGPSNELNREYVDLHSIYNVPNISKIMAKLFTKFRNMNKLKNGADELDEGIFEILISSFVIFSVQKQARQQSGVDNIFQGIHPPISINKLDEIVSISTPFGFENFFNTINRGIITNLFGENNSVFTISQTLSLGSEGCGVYNTRNQLVGLVICNSIYYGQDNLDFTMVGNFMEILKSICEQLSVAIPVQWTLSPLSNQSVPENVKECSVSIINRNTSGTGCFVHLDGFNFILTCSHVVNQAKDNMVTCRYKDGSFKAKIIYRNPHLGEAYDIAVLEVPANTISDQYFVECDPSSPRPGVKVFSIGFPVFATVVNDNYNPSIYDGHITKYQRGILFTDIPIQAGQSGGPILNESGHIIGISVQNIKLYDRIYPKSNMAVPICDIYDVLKSYVVENNIKLLEKIVADKNIAHNWRLGAQQILNKL